MAVGATHCSSLRAEYDYIFYTSFLRASGRDRCKKENDFTAR